MHRKIAFIGSVGSGKTTLVNCLSATNTLSTEVPSTQDIGKDMTTVGMDFGQLSLTDDIHIGLYGVPGQRQFSLVWDFIKQGLWAVIILIKNNEQASIDELGFLLDYFEVSPQRPCAIGITHTDLGDSSSTFSQVKQTLNERGLMLPVFSTDARKTTSGVLLLETVLAIDEWRVH